MKILCINPPQKINRKFIDYPPFTAYSLWYTAAYLCDCGFEIEVLDAFCQVESTVSECTPDYLSAGIPIASFEKHLSRSNFDVALVHANQYLVQEPDKRSLMNICLSIRSLHPGAKIILADLYTGGMNYIQWDAHGFLSGGSREKPIADYVLLFEAEEQLPELLKDIEGGKTPHQKIITGTAVSKLPELQSNPYAFADMAAFSAFTAEFYKTAGRSDAFDIGADCIPFKTSRGCPFRCSFCSSGSIPRARTAGWREYSTVTLERQLRCIAELKPARRVLLLDESANSNQQHFETFLELLADFRLRLEIPNGLRADLLNFATLKKLKNLISLLSISPECGSQNALDSLVGKKLKLESVERVAATCMGIGLPLAMHFIIGLPGESREELKATFDFARRMHNDYGARPWIQYAVPVPGTALFNRCVREGLLGDKLPADLNPAFQGGPLINNSPDGASPDELAEMLREFYSEPGMRH